MSDKLSPMQQEMINRADAIFASVGDVVSKAVEFGKEQIPDIAMQYVLFHRVYSTSIIVGSCFLLLLGLWLIINVAVRNTFKFPENMYIWDGSRAAAMSCGIIISVPSIITIFLQFKGFLLVWFAPKIFLIQSLVGLAKGVL